MNLQQLRSVIEVAETGSITAAARNLYVGQPNLSKSIRDLETELGIRLFQRTAHGVIPTEIGVRFLNSARAVIERMDELDAMFVPRSEQGMRLSVSVPRSEYAARAFRSCLRMASPAPMRTQYRETGSDAVIRDVSLGYADLGIVRWDVLELEALQQILHRSSLSGEQLWEFEAVILVSQTHPFTRKREITRAEREAYPEVFFGDPQAAESGIGANRGSIPAHSRITVFDRDTGLGLLHEIPGSWMWSDPLPEELAAKYHIAQMRCPNAMHLCDILVRRRPGAFSPFAVSYINELRKEIALLPQL